MIRTIARVIAAGGVALAALAAAEQAEAQNYNAWGYIGAGGLETTDSLGQVFYVDPYAYSSWRNDAGAVANNYYGADSPGIGWSQLTPTDPYGFYAGYGAGAAGAAGGYDAYGGYSAYDTSSTTAYSNSYTDTMSWSADAFSDYLRQ